MVSVPHDLIAIIARQLLGSAAEIADGTLDAGSSLRGLIALAGLDKATRETLDNEEHWRLCVRHRRGHS